MYYRIHENETNVTYDECYATQEAAEKVIAEYIESDNDPSDPRESRVTYRVLECDSPVYLAIYDSGAIVDCLSFPSVEDANTVAEDMWRRLTPKEKESRHVYVGYVTRDCLSDDAIHDDGTIDWRAFHSVYSVEGAFDSANH